jgi:hypothetical protein
MYLSAQDAILLSSTEEETTVIGDIEIWAGQFLDGDAGEEDYAAWTAWCLRECSRQLQATEETARALDASDE